MAFLGVDHQHAFVPKPLDQPRDGGDDRPNQADIIAQALAEPARLGEVALHVDDDERRTVLFEGIGERLGGDFAHQWCPAMWAPITEMSAVAIGVS